MHASLFLHNNRQSLTRMSLIIGQALVAVKVKQATRVEKVNRRCSLCIFRIDKSTLSSVICGTSMFAYIYKTSHGQHNQYSQVLGSNLPFLKISEVLG